MESLDAEPVEATPGIILEFLKSLGSCTVWGSSEKSIPLHGSGYQS
jgi:hypothetical protein